MAGIDAEPRYIDQSSNPFLNWLLGLSLAAIGIGLVMYSSAIR